MRQPVSDNILITQVHSHMAGFLEKSAFNPYELGEGLQGSESRCAYSGSYVFTRLYSS
jgi:hypothetical protein